MLLTAAGSSSLSLNIEPQFLVNTERSYSFIRLASGNYKVSDRGVSQDFYATEIDIRGTEAYIDNILFQIENNRNVIGLDNVVFLSGFNSQEKIFGAEIDYSVSSIHSTITSISEKRQTSWKGFSLTLGINALSTSFTGASSFPLLRFLDIGFNANASHTIEKKSSYDNTYSYIDNQFDSGLFSGTFKFTQVEMLGLRNFMRTNRGASFSLIGINGVDNPFGKRRDSGYPYNVRLLSVDERIYGIGKWKCSIVLAEEIE